MGTFKANFLNDIHTIFNKYDNEIIPAQHEKLNVIEKDCTHFYKVCHLNFLI